MTEHQYNQGLKELLENEDLLREKIAEFSPDINRDTKDLRDQIRALLAGLPPETKFPSEPTAAELEAWAHSSAHLYSNPKFEDWLFEHRKAHPVAELILEKNQRRNKDSDPDHIVKMRMNGVTYHGVAWNRKTQKKGPIKMEI